MLFSPDLVSPQAADQESTPCHKLRAYEGP
jgi:hypothetical protein